MILSLDTANLGGSVCLTHGKEAIASIIGDAGVSHSNTLLGDINQVLKTAGVTLNDVELFAAAAGPGSFTGLRIGLATVKAFGMTLSRPCAGIPTLHAIAHSCGPSSVVVAAQPAGRGEVFAQLLSVSSDGTVKELDTPSHVSPKVMIEKYGALTDLQWAGEGARLYQDKIRDAADERTIEFRDKPVNSASDGRGWVLADASGRYQPTEWAKTAISVYRAHRADRIVAEVNNGGDMVEATLRVIEPNAPFSAVRASRGKVTRAEPIAALYEQGRVHHLGVFPELEDQMCAFTADAHGNLSTRSAGYSPDRVSFGH